jgi:hypothetical protein
VAMPRSARGEGRQGLSIALAVRHHRSSRISERMSVSPLERRKSTHYSGIGESIKGPGLSRIDQYEDGSRSMMPPTHRCWFMI